MLKRPRKADEMIERSIEKEENSLYNMSDVMIGGDEMSEREKSNPKKIKIWERSDILTYGKDCIGHKLLQMIKTDVEIKRIEVFIPAHCISSNNKTVQFRLMWGDLIYTHDSDLIAVLFHMGYLRCIQMLSERIAYIQVILIALPNKSHYPSVFRNHIKSREWHSPKLDTNEDCSFEIEACYIISAHEESIKLEANVKNNQNNYLPTLSPYLSYLTESNSNTTIVFNLCNESWIKYSISAIGDRGFKNSQWMSAILYSNVLYCETKKSRFELSWSKRKHPEDNQEYYCWKKCKILYSQKIMKEKGIPLPSNDVYIIDSNLLWKDIKWGATFVKIKDVQYTLWCIKYMHRTKDITLESLS